MPFQTEAMPSGKQVNKLVRLRSHVVARPETIAPFGRRLCDLLHRRWRGCRHMVPAEADIRFRSGSSHFDNLFSTWSEQIGSCLPLAPSSPQRQPEQGRQHGHPGPGRRQTRHPANAGQRPANVRIFDHLVIFTAAVCTLLGTSHRACRRPFSKSCGSKKRHRNSGGVNERQGFDVAPSCRKLERLRQLGNQHGFCQRERQQ